MSPIYFIESKALTQFAFVQAAADHAVSDDHG